MTFCELCGTNNWKRINSQWIRCIKCGRLETVTTDKFCIKCGKQLGRYAKPKQRVCFACKETESKIPPEAQIPCLTPSCGNTLGQRASPTGYCRQCLREMNEWDTSDGHLWKKKAMSMLTDPIGRKDLLKYLKKYYPEITANTLFNWLLRHTKIGAVKRVGHGVYQAIPDYSPSPAPTIEGPHPQRINPNDPATWGRFVLTFYPPK